jgi:hypothetical protein
VNTAPGLFNRAQLEQAFANDWTGQPIPQEINEWSEVYTVKPSVWKAAGMTADGGCLCIGCLEKRLGRQLCPKDFPKGDPFNSVEVPGTERLQSRRWG